MSVLYYTQRKDVEAQKNSTTFGLSYIHEKGLCLTN